MLPPVDKQRALWYALRQALLMIVDAIEVFLAIDRTSELRKKSKKLDK